MKRTILVTTFAVYLIAVAGLTIIPTRLSRLQSPHSDHVNVIPFAYSFNCLRLAHRRHPGLMTFCLRHTFGNIALFLPLGIMLPLLDVRFRSIKTLLLTAGGLSLTIETIQFALRFIGSPRAVDIDDVLLNTLGACLGYAIVRIGVGRRQKAVGRRQ